MDGLGKSDVSRVTLMVFDVLGREVATLVDEKLRPGSYEIMLNSDGLASGVYFYRLTVSPTAGEQATRFVETKKLVGMG